jgi:hypothetical protein
MANLVTGTQVKTVVTAVVAFDPSFFDTSIQWVEDSVICGILTQPLYDDLLLELQTPPLSTAYQTLYDKVVTAEAYAVAFESYEKDLENKTNNQGIMENHTQYSKSASKSSAKKTIGVIKSREVFYCEALCAFLYEDSEKTTPDYPLFDSDLAYYKPELRGFFPL